MFELCTTCHKGAMTKGEFTGKDGGKHIMLLPKNSSSEERKATVMKMVQAAKLWRSDGKAAANLTTVMSSVDSAMLEQEQDYQECLHEMAMSAPVMAPEQDVQAGHYVGDFTDSLPISDFIYGHGQGTMEAAQAMGAEAAMSAEANARRPQREERGQAKRVRLATIPEETSGQQAMASQIYALQQQELARLNAMKRQE